MPCGIVCIEKYACTIVMRKVHEQVVTSVGMGAAKSDETRYIIRTVYSSYV